MWCHYVCLFQPLYHTKVLNFVTSSLQVGRNFENQQEMVNKRFLPILITTNLLTSMVILFIVHHVPQTCSVPSTTVQTDTVTTVETVQDKNFERRCISYSLYQPSDSVVTPLYSEGFLHNVELAKFLYPQWKIKLYLDIQMIDSEFHKRVSEYQEKVDIIWMKSNTTGHSGHMWRFLVADREDCDRWIVRDTDSRLSIRTMQATNEWIWSRRLFHIMRDHVEHDREVLAGMFGGVKGCLGNTSMEDLIKDFFSNPDNDPNDFVSDQKFLNKAVFPRIRHSFIAHDDFLDRHPPCKNHGNCRKFPVEDMPFVVKWRAQETLDCSCKTRCICKDDKCPYDQIINGDPPVCMNRTV